VLLHLEDVLQVHLPPLVELLLGDRVRGGRWLPYGGLGLDEGTLVLGFDVGGLGSGEDFLGLDPHRLVQTASAVLPRPADALPYAVASCGQPAEVVAFVVAEESEEEDEEEEDGDDCDGGGGGSGVIGEDSCGD
jgi:hypothetical protein